MEDKQVIKDKEGIPQILRVHHIFSRAQGRKKITGFGEQIGNMFVIIF